MTTKTKSKNVSTLEGKEKMTLEDAIAVAEELPAKGSRQEYFDQHILGPATRIMEDAKAHGINYVIVFQLDEPGDKQFKVSASIGISDKEQPSPATLKQVARLLQKSHESPIETEAAALFGSNPALAGSGDEILRGLLEAMNRLGD